ncbi:MAG: hypothetical protein E5Y88_22945 [Mesorhizobium sp.]|uniref:hypothetical protein n=1 Tax=unclassified Mesorhizobium TaxID=325217 RepID=UPI000F75655A|nr:MULTISPECIES: hypothetical protein [unclassified Mesorhizobium]AZO66938.1 hypothetical protein EJ075_19820 [Mesorhizobium sp. M6A.T.Cr.TU.016.01.1.1]RUU28652.1 hypothetical protein EOC94_17135 [Mesorhizobium sp. M6A.T.Ce.TU.016.01.1.1]RWP50326.1 MAG: hypothetical protein EOR05_07685 [Mesorhizobium sp.]RWQ38411.1 MAG: hypothetical protein EOS20_09070 [Mesorhizobium sp.]RWQ89003.1 MAG: hypothetical protein EOS85_02170 [Mesorhizobium sp.]
MSTILKFRAIASDQLPIVARSAKLPISPARWEIGRRFGFRQPPTLEDWARGVQPEAIALVFSLLCDGSYARNLFMVLICANDPPPRRVFLFQASAPRPFAFIDGHWANA